MILNEISNLTAEPSCNYVNLLDEEQYVTGKQIKNSKWRINDNLHKPINLTPFCQLSKIQKSKTLQQIYFR